MNGKAAPHTTSYRVYYEDTDAAGVVYYANYLKFAERARTEWLREFGFTQSAWLDEAGAGFVVTRCEIDYVAPARLDDMITIESCLHEIGKVRMTMQQTISRGGVELARLMVNLACVGGSGKPIRIPDIVLDGLKGLKEL